MNKSIAKEIIIALLLCLAILLVLSVLLYSYIPNNKVMPELVSYTTPEEAKEILKEAQADTSKVIMTYEVNGNELSTAQKNNSYNAGKVNPFSTYKTEENKGDASAGATNDGNTSGKSNSGEESTEGKDRESTNSDETNSNNKSSNDGSSSSSNGGTYYKNKGTK